MIQRRRRRSTVRSERKGISLVEFALVVPIIFLLFFGAIEMTNLNMVRHTAGNAAYEGARQVIVAGGTAEDARQEVLRLLTLVGIADGAEIEIIETAVAVEVIIRIPLRENSWGVTRFTGDAVIIQSCKLNREVIKHQLQ